MSVVEAYITDFPNPSVQLLLHTVHQFILDEIPEVETAIKWKVPFYSFRGPLCYLNPTKEGCVYLGFWNGHLLVSHHSLLQLQGRKQIGVVYIRQVEDVQNPDLAVLLQEAVLLNEL